VTQLLKRYWASGLLSGLLLFSTAANAEEEALWELVLGGGVLQTPKYIGSKQSRSFPFPLIYPVYRGERLRSDSDGVRGLLFTSERVELDVSFDGYTPVKSEGTLREGMPDLDASVQFGPMLKWQAWEDPAKRRYLIVNAPLRAAFAVDFDHVEHIGFTAFPHLSFYQYFDWLGRIWRLGLSAGVLFDSNDYHDYYYRIAPQYATLQRPQYDPSGGYGGARFIATLVSKTDKNWISFFARYDRLNGAAFADSPLVEDKGALTFGVAMAFTLARSKKTVEDKTLIKIRDR